MIPNPRFLAQPKDFWAHVRTISQEVGYTVKRQGIIKIPDGHDIQKCFEKLGLTTEHIVATNGDPTMFGRLLLEYFQWRADVLNDFVQPRLMDAKKAKSVFEELCKKYNPDSCDIPWNKQKGKKKKPAYLTAISGMLIRANAPQMPCDLNPMSLTTITSDGKPLRTLARRIDGAFPSVVNPIAVWEIKEYYHTTTFGSRVADGVYETLLDGMELEELREHGGIDVKHYLMIDARYTWWECGRSYLCRIIDMLHMGYVDEVLFGYEVVERLPSIVKDWVRLERARQSGSKAAIIDHLAGVGNEPK